MSEAAYGDVTAEYRALRGGAGLVETPHELIWVRGGDAVSFLDGLLSQDIAGMAAGTVGRSFLLQARGKIEALLWVLRGDRDVGLIADPGCGGALAEALERFRFRVDATVEAGPPAAEVWGPAAPAALATAGLPAPEGWTGCEGGIVARFPLGGLDRYLVPAGAAAGLGDAGAVRCGTIAATTVRVEAGEPWTGVDVDGSTIPQETGLVPAAVSFSKGCYLGQELVARIDSRGRVNRRLRAVVLTDTVIPPEGAVVKAGDLEAGTITSVGESLAVRAPVALAVLRREAEPGARVEIEWDGGTAGATVAEVPLDDFSTG